MFTSHLARRRRRLGALLVGACVVAASAGTAALADSTGSGASVSVDASVLVQAGMSPISARQAAANLNAAIDSAAQTVANSAAAAVSSVRPVRTTAAATKAFATEVDGALTQFAVTSLPALRAAGATADAAVKGTLAALAQVVRTIPGAVGFTAGAELAVAGGADGVSASASLNPKVDPAIRQTVSGTVAALQPLLPLSRATLAAVAHGIRQVVDASIVAVDRIVRATVDFAAAIVTMTDATRQAARAVAESAVTAITAIVSTADSILDNVSDVNVSAQVDAGLRVSAH
jgi:hypothetical protein